MIVCDAHCSIDCVRVMEDIYLVREVAIFSLISCEPIESQRSLGSS